MRIPLTKYGLPQVAVYPAVIAAAMAIIAVVGLAHGPTWGVVVAETLAGSILFWALMFFRDPHREVPQDEMLLLAPADGRVTDIDAVDEGGPLDGPSHRIGIFLSIFNTHINRAPCSVKIEKITYRKGQYLNAMNPRSSKVNESNEVVMTRTDAPREPLAVRQISGAIARHIVCAARQGQYLGAGEKFGMIKFGSRTELYVPANEHIKCLVKIGDKVKAGLTPLMRYQICQD